MDTKGSLTRQDHKPVARGIGNRTAAQVKELRGRLGLTGDALQQIPVVDEGTPLHQGSTYLDLNKLEAGPFTAMAEQHAEADQVLIRKPDVPYEIWNHLVGDEKPGQALDGAPLYGGETEEGGGA